MLHVALVTFPFFALVLAGFVAAYRGMLPIDAIPGLNGFVLFFALPCMLYRFGASTPLVQLLDANVLLTYVLCALLVVAFTVAVTLSPRIGWNDAAFGALVAAFPNTGFMGVPLLVALLGPQAAGPAIVTILVDMVMTSSLCIALSRLVRGPAAGPGQAQGAVAQTTLLKGALKAAMKGVLTNPLPWSILLGACASAMAFTLPKPLAQTLGLLADAASPVALFTIGAVLARAQKRATTAKKSDLAMKAAGAPARWPDHGAQTGWADVLPVCAIKLVLHPLLVLLVGATLRQLGLPLTQFALVVMVLVAALPSASNVSLLAERFGADTGRIARIILVTTAVAFFTFAAAVSLLV